MKQNLISHVIRLACLAVFALVLAQPAFAQGQPAPGAEPAPVAPVAPAAGEAAEEIFVSWDTLIVGCAAGGFSAAVSAILPLFTAYAAGGPTSVTWDLLGAWGGLGCAVGIWAGIIAIGTALLLEAA